MDIGDWRKKIDELDEKLVKLLNERSRVAAEVAKLKRQAGMPLYQPEREQEILERIRKMNGGPLTNDALKRLFERILDEARTVEQEFYKDKK